MSDEAVPAERLAAERLAGLVLLMARARDAATQIEIAHMLVNDTASLAPFRNALVWRHGKMVAVSGLPTPVADAPFTVWSSALCRHLAAGGSKGPVVVDGAMVPDDIHREWNDFLPAHVLWLPLATRAANTDALLLARDTPWGEAIVRFLAQWARSGGHALDALEPKHWGNPLVLLRRRHRLVRYAAAALLALVLPVHLSVLAPAEIGPRDPVLVRAPLSGVIADVTVQPNAAVKAGDVLARLDSRELESKLLVVRQGLETAEAQYRLSLQTGIVDNKAQADAAIAKAQMDEHQAEVAQVEELLRRIAITAEFDGLAVFADSASLVGKPVRLGEKLMTLADPAKVQIDIWIPMADNVDFAPGDAVQLFLNVAPDRGVSGTLRIVNYQAAATPDGQIAYHAIADLAAGEIPPRIGLRGTAKVLGPEVTIGYLLLRRPVAALRQALGL